MKRLVIDASVLVKLFFDEPHSEASVRHVKGAAELLAPDLLWAEVASVIWKRLRREEISVTEAGGLLDEMLRMPIVTCSNLELAQAALGLAAQTGRTVYDSMYLALAIRENIPLLTGDERLASGPHAKWVRFVGASA